MFTVLDTFILHPSDTIDASVTVNCGDTIALSCCVVFLFAELTF